MKKMVENAISTVSVAFSAINLMTKSNSWSGVGAFLRRNICFKLRQASMLLMALVFTVSQATMASSQALATGSQNPSTVHPMIRDMNMVSQELNNIKSKIQFEDANGNILEISNVLQVLDLNQFIYVTSVEANPNRLRISKSYSPGSASTSTLRVDQFVGNRLASSTILRLDVNTDFSQSVYQKLFGEGQEEMKTKTEYQKLANGTVIHRSKNSLFVCEEGADAVTGKPLRYVTMSIGPDNLGSLAILLLPGLVLYMGHPARMNKGSLIMVFMIAAFLLGSGGYLYWVGNKTGCN